MSTPERFLAAKEMGKFLKAISHPLRIRIIGELRAGEKDVNTLHQVLRIPHSGVSQHLSVLRLFRIVEERREGRHVYYHLTKSEMADWLLSGLHFLAADTETQKVIERATVMIKTAWEGSQPSLTRRQARAQEASGKPKNIAVRKN